MHFFKNIMMAGGLLQITAFGAGSLSLDNYLKPQQQIPMEIAPAR